MSFTMTVKRIVPKYQWLDAARKDEIKMAMCEELLARMEERNLGPVAALVFDLEPCSPLEVEINAHVECATVTKENK